MAVPVEVDEDRGLSRPRHLAHPAFGHVAVVDELGDQIGDRHPGQTRLTGKVRATHGTLVEEGLQHERAIVRPRMLRQHLRCMAQRAARHDGAGRRCRIDGATREIRSGHVC